MNTLTLVITDTDCIDLDKTITANDAFMHSTARPIDIIEPIVNECNAQINEVNTYISKHENQYKETVNDIEGTLQAISNTEAYLKEFKGEYTVEQVIHDIVAGIREDIKNNIDRDITCG